MGRYIAICTVCDEGTNEPWYCDKCGSVFCGECGEGNLSEQGNDIDDIQTVCDSCIKERV